MIYIDKAIFLLILFCSSVVASDEKLVIDHVKYNYNYLDDTKFKVKKTDRFKDYYYFCGFAVDGSHNPIKRDGLVEVYDLLMKREGGNKLKEIANFNSFSNEGEGSCFLKGGINDFMIKMDVQNNKCTKVENGDSERKSILDAVRIGHKKFIVKRLCSSLQFAYFCGIAQDENGFLIGTDEAIDVYDVILKKNTGGNWIPVKDFGGFSMNLNDVKCHFGQEGTVLEKITLENAADHFIENK